MTKALDKVDKAEEYYDTAEADRFYHLAWAGGKGDHMHLGIYESKDDTVLTASERTIERMSNGPLNLDSSKRVLDLGGGFGGTARALTKKFGCHVTCLNISKLENEHNDKVNKEQGLQDRIKVVYGSFDKIPFEDNSFDVVWSQDAIIHANDKEKVVQETSRVLKPSGYFVFSDILVLSDDIPKSELQAIYDRVHINNLGSEKSYTAYGEKYGLNLVSFEDLKENVAISYGNILNSVKERYNYFVQNGVSKEFLDRSQKGLKVWVDGGNSGKLGWGIFKFQKK